MKSINDILKRAALSLVGVTGLLGSGASDASTCVSPSLDATFNRAKEVFVARLVAATLSDDYSAQIDVVLDTGLKGSPPDRLTIKTNIGPIPYCGPDLTIGHHYVVFLTGSQPVLVLANDAKVLRWIEGKIRTLTLDSASARSFMDDCFWPKAAPRKIQYTVS